MVCDKDGVCVTKMVCDKAVCESWHVTIVSKMVCERLCVCDKDIDIA